MTTMGELTASLAHEVNQPIAAAVTDANTCLRWLARDHPDLEEAREAASRMVKDVTRAADIINRIRLLFKKGTPQRELVDVNEVVREMIVLLRSEATRYSISIRTELAADLPQVMGDRVQLQQVLMNLMLNGIDAMKDVDGTRELIIKSQPAKNDQLLVSVSDTGVGLPPQQADQIFNAFFTTKPMGPAWDSASAAPSSNRMVAACGLLTTPRAAQVFVSPYPPKPRQMNEARRRPHSAAVHFARALQHQSNRPARNSGACVPSCHIALPSSRVYPVSCIIQGGPFNKLEFVMFCVALMPSFQSLSTAETDRDCARHYGRCCPSAQRLLFLPSS